jgi:chromosome segregation ATPase
MATIRPDDLSLSALPRTRFGHLSEEAVAELLQRVSWDLREAVGQKQRLAAKVEELTRISEELNAQVASLEEETARRKDPDELLRTLLTTAQRAAREQRDSARRDCELMLKKAAHRVKRVESNSARRIESRMSELQKLEATQKALVAEARETATSITTEAQDQAAALLEQVAALAQEREQEADAAREQFEQELVAARNALAEEQKAARAEADAALAEARRELARLENEATRVESLVAETRRRAAEITQAALTELEDLHAATSSGEEANLLGDLQPSVAPSDAGAS